MLFNSIEFFILLVLFFIIYWFVFNKNLKFQNILILVTSYIFYGWWDYRFLSLIFLSTFVDYIIGIKIQNQTKKLKRKRLIWLSVIFNLGTLCIFKYFNFFIDSWIEIFNTFGFNINSNYSINVILPVGISFYTFQTMSYTIDIYKKELNATKDFIAFASFVSFFPQLVAGPIERASNLLPQILNKRKFNYVQAVQGVKLIMWGLFKKVVIADYFSVYIDDIFGNFNNYGGTTLWMGAFYFAFQIYCDFSGYSDIAIGTSKLFGIELMTNFKFPYFSRNITEFWSRWHISLTSWFRDYLYIPIGGSKSGKIITIRNIFIVFLVSGLWHGANWTFIFWGLINAFFFIMEFIFIKKRKYINDAVSGNNIFPKISDFIKIIITFLLVTICWVFFRSENINNAFLYIFKMFSGFSDIPNLNFGIVYILLLIALEWLQRKDERDILNFKNKLINILICFVLFVLILISFFKEENRNFIYFQF